VSLEAEGQHRDADEEHGHHCYHLSDRSGIWQDRLQANLCRPVCGGGGRKRIEWKR
jgi:hypothetical protein